MRKSLFLFFLIVATACTPKNENQLKVLAWNVWHAGHLEYYGEKACEATIGILCASKADVIFMVETYGAAQMVADSLGFHHELLSSNLCIFSRYPITRKFTFADSISTFNFGGVEIDFKGKPVVLFDTWLHYLPDIRVTPTDLSETEILAWENDGSRDDEMRTILSVLKPFIAASDSVPVIMGGDFNSYSHLDWTEATCNLHHHGGAVVEWSISKMLTDAGFTDSFREANPDPATTPGTTWIEAVSDSLPTRYDRIDFIYYRGRGVSLESSKSYDAPKGTPLKYKGNDFFYPSDHGFVVSTFNIK